MDARIDPLPTDPLLTDPLLSIGMFSRRSRLSVKALRRYGRLGLLVPAATDPSSGYRRYRESQLDTARLVVMLRRLDMPLAQVAEVITAPSEQAVGLIESYWNAAERRIASQRQLTGHPQIKLSGKYFTDFLAAEPSEEACDVAFPME
jgi:DNA-binding transcriptional MerR regulator